MDSILLFAVVLSIAGGGIAFIGDRLGTWVGKKRLSKFGLRPKHTAMLYTTITGGIIATLTLALLLIVDHDVQYAITRGMAEIHRDRMVMREDKKAISGYRVESANAQVDAARAKQVALKAKLAEAEAEQAEAKATGQLAKAHAMVAAVQGELSVDRKKLAVEETRLVSAQSDLTSAKARVLTEAAQVSKERGLNQQAVAKLVKDSRRLVELENSVSNRERKVAQLDTRVASLENQSRTLVTVNEHLKKRTLDLESHVDIYQAGDQIDRLVLETSLSPQDIRARLADWLGTLSLDAAARGAGPGDDGRDITVQGDGSETASELIPEDASLDMLSDHISQQRKIVDSVIVQAVARFNTERGGQVPVDLQSFDNVLVFPKGGAVATTVIDGTLPQHDVMERLTAFLSEDLKAAARNRSVMPYVDPETLKVRYGAIDGHLLDIVGQIQSAGPNARVTAVASDNVYTEGPLKVHLQVDSAPTASDSPDSGVTTAGATERRTTPAPMAHL